MKILQFLAIILTALALVPGGAHLFALPNKIATAQDTYFVMQSIYRGWALFSFVLFGALAANAASAFALRKQQAKTPCILAALAACGIALTLVIFFIWTFPANQATDNWNAVPDNWEGLRRQWEYSHAANAAITFLALCAATLSALTSRAPSAHR